MTQEEIKKFPLIEVMANAIQKHEGWHKGSRSFRNNNPGNFVCTAFVKKWLGAIGCEKDGRFAVFANYEDGFFAIKLFLWFAAMDELRAYSSNMTLLKFFSVYAPSSDGNSPKNYAAAVQADLGVKSSFKISQLLVTNPEMPEIERETPKEEPQEDAGEPKTDPEAIDYSERPKGTSRREWFAKLTGLPRSLYSRYIKKEETKTIAVLNADTVADPEGFETYEVQAGDTLAKIALALCGKESAWQEIFKANENEIADANLIHVGQKLRIPKSLMKK